MKNFLRITLRVIIFILIGGLLANLPIPDGYEQWTSKNPNAGRNIDAAVNIALLVFTGWIAWRLTRRKDVK